MSEASKAVAAPGELTFHGKKYKLAPMTIEMIGMFDAWIEQRAYEAVERGRSLIPDDVYRDRLDSVTRLISSGRLGYGSVACLEAAKSLPGLKYCMLMQLQAGNPGCHEIDEKFVDEVFKDYQEQALIAMRKVNIADPTIAAP